MAIVRSKWSSRFPTVKSVILSMTLLIVSVIVLCILFFRSQEFVEEKVSAHGKFARAAVSTDAIPCGQIGADILRRNGTAVDAGIATLFCMGLTIPESNGIGGGSYWTIYHKGSVTVIDSREQAPSYATKDMYKDPKKSHFYGLYAFAIPAEVAGSWEAHQRFGRLPWKDLIQPTIDLAKNGFSVGEHLSTAIRQKWKEIKNHSEILHEMFTNKETGKPYAEGDTFKRPDLAKTLEVIAEEGKDSLYTPNGTLVKLVVQDLQDMGSKIKIEDITGYSVKVHESVVPRILTNGMKVYSTPLPASGDLLSFILDTALKAVGQIYGKPLDDSHLYRVLVEAWKFAYAQRSVLGDPAFENKETEDTVALIKDPDYASHVARIIRNMKTTENNGSFYQKDGLAFRADSGTSALSVNDDEGTVLSIGATINSYFGSMIVSPSTGIILNNQMDDFSHKTTEWEVRPSNHNLVEAGKRPLSSMCPVIIMDEKDNFVMTLSASGGTHITSSVSLTILRYLLQHKSFLQAVDEPRLHHQLYPMILRHEASFSADLLADLQSFGHNTSFIVGRGSIVMGIAKVHNSSLLEAVSDKRKGGEVDGY